MSFYENWITDGKNVLISGGRRVMAAEKLGLIDPDTLVQAKYELRVLKQTLDHMSASKIIRMPDHQLQEFVSIPMNHAQDFNLLNSPFPDVYMDVNPPLPMPEFWDEINTQVRSEARIMGFMISEMPLTDRQEKLGMTIGTLKETAILKRSWRLTVFVPLKDAPENTYLVSFGLTSDGELIRPEANFTGKHDAQHRQFFSMAVHVMNYLTSPTIVLERNVHSPALQKARARRNKPPLPDWYEIRYAKTRRAAADGSGSETTGSKHSFRYDVRGHFAHFKKGPMAGRMIWIPAHQRGIANDVYKPKVYTV